MYIHLLQFQELPRNVFKIIYTDDNINIVKDIHTTYYNVKDVYTYETIENKDYNKIFELLEKYKNNGNFYYCNNIGSLEKLIEISDSFFECLENINPKNILLGFDIDSVLEIISKHFYNDILDKERYINQYSLDNLKEFNEDTHEIYIEEDFIKCIKKSTTPISQSCKVYKLFVKDKTLCICEKQNEVKYIPTELFFGRIAELTSNEIEPFSSVSSMAEEIVSNDTKVYYNVNSLNRTIEELEKEREEELSKPTTMQTYEETEAEIEEEEESNDEEIISLVNNKILDKKIIVYGRETIERTKNVNYLPEIETVSEYVVVDLDAIKNLLEIKHKNNPNITQYIIEKDITKINDFLYGDKAPTNTCLDTNIKDACLDVDIKDMVHRFISDEYIKKVGSKIYSNVLYREFTEYLMRVSPRHSMFVNKNNFTPILKQLNYKTKRDSNGIYWIDLERTKKNNIHIQYLN